jgi:hypothetical protein
MSETIGTLIDNMADEEAKMLIKEMETLAVRGVCNQIHNFDILSDGRVDSVRSASADEKYVIVRTVANRKDTELLVRYTMRGPRGADSGVGDVTVTFTTSSISDPTWPPADLQFKDNLNRLNHFDVATWLTILRYM